MSDNTKIKARLKVFSKLDNTIKIDTEDVITDAPISSNEAIYGRQNKEWVDIGEKFKLGQLALHQNEVDDSLTSLNSKVDDGLSDLNNKIDSNVSNLQNQVNLEVRERTEGIEKLNEECSDLNNKVSSIKIEVNDIDNKATFSGTPGTTETATFRTGHNIDERTIILNRDNQLQTNLNLINGEGNYSISQSYQVNGEDYSARATGENSAAFGGRRTGEIYKNDPATQARGIQSFAAGASCEADGEASVAMGMGAEAYQRSAVAIGKACKSGLTIEEFNDKYATDAQKEVPAYDRTKINGGVSMMSIKDNHGDEYPSSYSVSFATGVDSKAAGWGAFVGGLSNKSLADGAATFGSANKNSGVNAFVAGASNEVSTPKSFLFGEGLKQTRGNGPAFVVGKYNEDRGDYVFAIGAGTEDSDRKNILAVNGSSGKMTVNGSIEAEFSSVGWASAPDKAVVNKGTLKDQLANKSNATNWRNGSGAATVVLQEATNTSGSSKSTVVAGQNSKASNANGSAILAGYSNDIASASYSSILNGKFNESTHDRCIVGGVGNRTTSNDQNIFGTYSSLDKDALFIVGNGTGDDFENRNNALTVKKDGRLEVTGTPKNIHDVVRLQELDTVNTALTNALSNLDIKYENTTKSLEDDKLDKIGGTITGDLSITGNLTVNGKQEAVETTSLKVDDPVIITNGSKAPLSTILSGLAINTNEESSYGIVYNNNKDTVELGLGKVSESGIFTFNENEGRPLAVRDDSSNFINNNLVQALKNGDSIVLKDSGKSINDFADASVSTNLQGHINNKNNPHGVTKAQLELDQVDNTSDINKPVSNATQEALSTKLNKPVDLGVDYKLVTANDSSTGVLSYTDAPTGFTVMQRDANGRAQISAPLGDNDIANKSYVDNAALGTYTFKTLFGNQNIVGTGNIDLYRHNLYFITDVGDLYCMFITSSSVEINSLTDFFTVTSKMGTQIPMNGFIGGIGTVYMVDTSANGRIYYNTPDGSSSVLHESRMWASATPVTIRDTVTTV